ncbi:ammonium transporter [Candidatus Poribacteria bacterium]|nr:ammonium transporter [Candidatus Poribacteria bacterium]
MHAALRRASSRSHVRVAGLSLSLILCLGVLAAAAQTTDEATAPVVETATAAADSGDTAWMLVSSGLVLLMVPGLALFYGGMVRRKNVLSSMMHSFIALGVVGIQWVVVGYSIAFGDSIGGWVGNPMSKFLMLSVRPDSLWGTVPESTFAMFQGMFAIITPALISGAIAERVRFRAYVLFILLWSTLVYDPLAHWVWNPDGWLLKLGALDFAGGTVVHLSSGISALVMAKMLGSRRGYPSGDMLPHNLTMTLLGAGLLWFGWFGFNAGSAVASNSTAAVAFAATHIAAASGILGWLAVEKLHRGHPSALGAASGLVAGLVGVTPAAGFVAPWAAIVIGLTVGALCYGAVVMKGRFGYDDSLDAFGVHGVGGTWGALMTGVVATIGASGLVLGNAGQLADQFVAVVAAGAYAVIVTWILFKIIDAVVGFRIDPESEQIGLDQVEHGEVGYNM